MKQVLMQFSEHVLSRSQMKSIKGGYGDDGAACPAGACWGTVKDCGSGCTKCSSTSSSTLGECS